VVDDQGPAVTPKLQRRPGWRGGAIPVFTMAIPVFTMAIPVITMRRSR